MPEIISVRFKSGGKQYYFDPGPLVVAAGQGVIVDTTRGMEYARCIRGNTQVEESQVVSPLRGVVRLATPEDECQVAANREKERKAAQICRAKILEHGLDMKLVDVEYGFETGKIMFFFTSEGRVDFRALVKDLASIFHARIELRQIGVRDEAKLLGGLGICGKPFCCASFLDDFQPVSIKMAKTQSLSLNPTKISGTCGRLMCCLKYEQEAYEDLVKRAPKQESFVETPDGVGTVSAVNLLREQVKVRLEDVTDAPKTYHNCEVRVVRSGKGKRPEGYVPPPAEELARRRRPPEPKEEERWPRSSFVSGGAATLSTLLPSVPAEEVLPAQEAEFKPRQPKEGKNRRRRSGAPPSGQEAATPPVVQPTPQKGGQERRQSPKKPASQSQPGGERRQNPAPSKAAPQPKTPEVPAAAGEKTGDKKPRRRWRPRNKGGAKPTA